ncbi:MAG TPA: hypothetical protein PK307_00210 [Spirochaetota bacterium]|nr:hypothetical protein [Spirochaetota bacterium]HOD15773.1 hypothetical protein [Spirochaetota bacterium]HPN12978.1 hypothetical protein [Spirochaetota bacterium]HQL80592.1 hypothetical protein [Spirochaetota bacterium]
MFRPVLTALALMVLSGSSAFASGTLFYLEAQGVGGYSSAAREAVFYSQHQEDAMQKPSIGFDFLHRFSGEQGDIGSLAIQMRAAFDRTKPEDSYIEPQLYNLYLKFKTPGPDIWIGHSRPALGLSSYFDSHGLLLPTLAMAGFGFDRDWGIGLYRQFNFGDLSVTATTGSGMPLYLKGSYLASARISVGVLDRDNYTIGFSGGYGSVLDNMGVTVTSHDRDEFGMGGIDYTHLVNNLEFRLEGLAGKKMGEFAAGVMLRAGVNLLEENRLKLEVQPEYWRMGHDNNYRVSTGISYVITDYLTARAMYQYDYLTNDHRAVAQLYLYWRA